jgi:hypothetical protein
MNIEKSLEATQFVHRLLISACLTILVFVLSSEPVEDPYIRASAQLDSLESALSAATSLVDGGIEAEQVKVASIFNAAFPSVLDLKREQVQLGQGVWSSPRTVGDLKLDSIYHYVDSRGWEDDRAYVYAVDSASLHVALTRFAKLNPKLKQVRSITITPNGDPDNEGPVRAAVKIQLKMSDARELTSRTLQDSILLGGFRTIGASQLDSIFSAYKLVTPEDGEAQRQAFPELTPVWFEIGPMTERSAASFLRLQAQKAQAGTRTEISLMGFKVPPRMLALAAPGLVLFLMVYLLAHLHHLYVMREGQVDTLRCFPWMGVHTNQLGKVLMYGSVTVLPVGCVALMLDTARMVNSSPRPLQDALILVGIVVVGYLSIQQLRLLNRYVAAQVAAEAARKAAAAPEPPEPQSEPQQEPQPEPALPTNLAIAGD